MSIIKLAPIGAESFCKASSFINKAGIQPQIGRLLHWNKIVLRKEELIDDNWLYVGLDLKEIVEKQMRTLTSHNGFTAILEE